MFDIKTAGIILKKDKRILDLPIEVMPAPSKVYIHFTQHKGNPAIPIVKLGDFVKIGTRIGEPEDGISAAVHSSISGKVLEIKSYPHPILGEGLCCIIESDHSEDWEDKSTMDPDYESLDKNQLLEKIKNAGIVGLGGGGFPTDIKLLAGTGKKIELLIINCCESEPNVSSDYRILLEYTPSVVEGARLIQKILDAPRVVFALSNIYKKAGKLLKNEGVEVKILSNRYPQGSERLLVKRLVKIDLPKENLPVDYGILVQNVSTCYAVFQAAKYNKPLIERVVTISGDGINEQKNLLVRIGTPIKDIIEYCGGLKKDIKKIIFGGLMTGIAQFSLETPVIKTVNGIVFQNKIIYEEMSDCIRCGKCVDVCPVNIPPQVIYSYIKENKFNLAIAYGLNECIECGCCAYECPASIPLLHYFKYARLRMTDE